MPTDHDVPSRTEMNRCALVLLAALGCVAVGCNGSSPSGGECTLVGCENEFAVTVSVDAAAVASGTHSLRVTADGTVTSCTFTFPPDAGANAYVPAQCSGGLLAELAPAMKCTNVETTTGSMSDCKSIGGKFDESISLMGTPQSVRIEQRVDGRVIFDQTFAPAYKTVEPNGPACGPICHQATATSTIP